MNIIPLITSLGIGMYGKWRLQKLLSKIIFVADRSLSLFYRRSSARWWFSDFIEAYLGLVHSGVGAPDAVMLIVSILLAALCLGIAVARFHVRRLRKLTGPNQPPIVDEACTLFDAFMDGLLSQS